MALGYVRWLRARLLRSCAEEVAEPVACEHGECEGHLKAAPTTPRSNTRKLAHRGSASRSACIFDIRFHLDQVLKAAAEVQFCVPQNVTHALALARQQPRLRLL